MKITEELESKIREKVSGGLYVDESDVVRDALRALEQRDEFRVPEDDVESSPSGEENVARFTVATIVGMSNSELMKITCDVMRMLGLENWQYHALVQARGFNNDPSSFDEVAPELCFWFVDHRNQTHTFRIRMELIEYPLTLEEWLKRKLEEELRGIVSFLSWYDRDAHTVKLNV